MFGLQSSLIPVYATLLQSPSKSNTIYPLLGMGGFAMLGGMLALYLLAPKGGEFRKNTRPSFITSFLGIDEPTLYGTILPRIVPLFTCAIAAGVSGLGVGLVQALLDRTMGVQMLYGVDGI